MAGPGVTAIAGGGDAVRLERELEALAASATAILSSGLAGALDPELKVGDVVIGTVARPSPHAGEGSDGVPSVILMDRLARLASFARRGLVFGSDTPVASGAEKAALHRNTGAMAIDMESHVAARVAARHGLPFAAVRVISDAADATLPPAALAGMRPDGGIAIGAILVSLARDPGQIPALIRTARDADTAFRALGRLHDMLRGFGIGRLDPRQLAFDVT